MKLCRFELHSSPGEVRSGIVHSGRIYETDGANPIAVHEAQDVRPLPPVGKPNAIRFFRISDSDILEDQGSVPLYSFGNPEGLIGASQIVPQPEFTSELDYEPYLAAILGQDGYCIPIEEADGYVLGLSILNVLVARDVERWEAKSGSGPGRSRDFALALGPVLTTPEELDDAVISLARGRQYKLTVVAQVNGVERRRGAVEDLPFTIAEAIHTSSLSSPVRAGDLFALGPIARPEDTFRALEHGDEFHVAVERLGTLATKIE